MNFLNSNTYFNLKSPQCLILIKNIYRSYFYTPKCQKSNLLQVNAKQQGQDHTNWCGGLAHIQTAILNIIIKVGH